MRLYSDSKLDWSLSLTTSLCFTFQKRNFSFLNLISPNILRFSFKSVWFSERVPYEYGVYLRCGELCGWENRPTIRFVAYTFGGQFSDINSYADSAGFPSLLLLLAKEIVQKSGLSILRSFANVLSDKLVSFRGNDIVLCPPNPRKFHWLKYLYT